MFLPPGPMSAPIFSGLILTVSMRGAYLLISVRGSARVLAISPRIVQAGDAGLFDGFGHDARAAGRLSLRSSWKPVMPFSVPAILQSMSQNASSQPMMSVRSW